MAVNAAIHSALQSLAVLKGNVAPPGPISGRLLGVPPPLLLLEMRPGKRHSSHPAPLAACQVTVN